MREATKKSLVVRENRSPQVPMARVATVTRTTATMPGTVLTESSRVASSTRSAKSRSLASARRT